MYGHSSAQIKAKAIVSLVIAVIISIICIFTGELPLGFGSMNEILVTLLILILAPVALTWGFLAMFINWKKIFVGLIKPIPIVSYLLEFFKALIIAPIALVWALTHPNA